MLYQESFGDNRVIFNVSCLMGSFCPTFDIFIMLKEFQVVSKTPILVN